MGETFGFGDAAGSGHNQLAQFSTPWHLELASDTQKQGAPHPGDNQTGSGSAPAAESPALKEANDTMMKFLQAPDKDAALLQLAPTFEDAISKADQEFKTITEPAYKEYDSKVGPALDADLKNIDQASKQMNAEISKLSDADQQKLTALLNELPTASAARQQQIESTITSQFPGVAKAAESVEKAYDEALPLIKQFGGLEQKFDQALSNSYVARLEYMTALKEGHAPAEVTDELSRELLMLQARTELGFIPPKAAQEPQNQPRTYTA